MKLKDLPYLGLNIESDRYLLGTYQTTAVSKPYYRGGGKLSVKELEKLCEEFEEYCYQQALIKNKLIVEIKNSDHESL